MLVRVPVSSASEDTLNPNSLTPSVPLTPRAIQRLTANLRDQGVKSNWLSLNGLWEWEKAETDVTNPPFGKTLSGSILVPFPVESCLSGVAPVRSADIVTNMWYRLVLDVPATSGRVILHFGSVDWNTTVFVNQKLVGNHVGGFDGFDFDITSALASSSSAEIMVHVFDPSDSGAQPNGKQRISALDNPGGDTYTPNSGIWQTVWLEAVPDVYVSSLQIYSSNVSASVKIDAFGAAQDTTATITVSEGDKVVSVVTTSVDATILLTVPSPRLWSPTDPHLYNLTIVLSTGDAVISYFGMRSLVLGFSNTSIGPSGPQPGVDRPGQDLSGSPFELTSPDPNLCWAACNHTVACQSWVYGVPGCDSYSKPMCWLKGSVPAPQVNNCRVSGTQGASSTTQTVFNGKVTFFAGWLDQSWWPDGQYTAPTDEALKFDIQAALTFGFNLIRLHQKVNSERWYYYADTLGVAVFQDAVQKYGGATAETVPFYIHDLTAMINQRGNHPCIVQWEVFNEEDCWAVFTTPPYTVNEVVDLARRLDWQGRLVNTDSGGGANNAPYNNGDVNDIHTYPNPGFPLPSATKYAMVGEFGGLGAFIKGKEWVPDQCYSYEQVADSHALANRYVGFTQTFVSEIPFVSASVYTQITDVELECDGFYNYDRTIKFSDADTEAVAAANRALIATLGAR